MVRRYLIAAAIACCLIGTAVAQQQYSAGSAWVSLAGQTYTHIVSNGSTGIKATPGVFVGIVVNSGGTSSTASIYDDADGVCNTGLIATVDTTTRTSLTYNAAAKVGICVLTAGVGTADITILSR